MGSFGEGFNAFWRSAGSGSGVGYLTGWVLAVVLFTTVARAVGLLLRWLLVGG